jgi:hypothetical protein
MVPVVVRLVFELELRFGDTRSMLERWIQTSTWGTCFFLRRTRGRSAGQ